MKTKQVIILRKDLNMRKGKMVAQGSHASMAAILNQGEYDENSQGGITFNLELSSELAAWLHNSFTKVCVGVDSEDELHEIYNQAVLADLPRALIRDSGQTEFNGVPTYTAVAIGPADVNKIDPITKHLKLL